MQQDKPRVAIGLPVYNGEESLSRALDSILAQTYRDFELIISDNASTDKTQEICLAYAAQDARVKYYRNDVNLGLTRNFNRAFELSDSEYFAFMAHDDYLAPDFIAKCIEVLDRDPSIILCHCLVLLVDEQGNKVAEYDDKLKFPHEGSVYAHQRFRDLIMTPHLCLDDYGLIRSNVLTMKPLYESNFGSDRNFLAELSLRGKFYHVPEYLFFWRDQRKRDLPFALWSARLDATKASKIPLPRWSIFAGYLRAVKRNRLSPKERLLCYLALGEWLPRKARGLGKDLLMAGRLLLQRQSGRLSEKLQRTKQRVASDSRF